MKPSRTEAALDAWRKSIDESRRWLFREWLTDLVATVFFGAALVVQAAGEADRAELRSELNRCLAEITPEQARVVVLKDALGFSFEEISSVADMPVGTAKCYAHRARAGLRARLTDEHAA